MESQESMDQTWHTENGMKQPYYISLKSGETMAFAGLWEALQPASGEPRAEPHRCPQ